MATSDRELLDQAVIGIAHASIDVAVAQPFQAKEALAAAWENYRFLSARYIALAEACRKQDGVDRRGFDDDNEPDQLIFPYVLVERCVVAALPSLEGE